MKLTEVSYQFIEVKGDNMIDDAVVAKEQLLVCSVSFVLDMEQKIVQDMCAGWDNLQYLRIIPLSSLKK